MDETSERAFTNGSADLENVSQTRWQLMRRGIGVATFLGGGALLARHLEPAEATPSAAGDAEIFNFALLLEYLQAAFYTDAVSRGKLHGELRDFAEVVASHERDHVQFLRDTLGSKARQKPDFEFGDATRDEQKFARTALLLENIGVAAYNGQAANLTKRGLSAAVEIVSVEGRHAAWISDLTGKDPAPRAADPGQSATQVAAALRATGFLKSS
jgi:rubrerythrin